MLLSSQYTYTGQIRKNTLYAKSTCQCKIVSKEDLPELQGVQDNCPLDNSHFMTIVFQTISLLGQLPFGLQLGQLQCPFGQFPLQDICPILSAKSNRPSVFEGELSQKGNCTKKGIVQRPIVLFHRCTYINLTFQISLRWKYLSALFAHFNKVVRMSHCLVKNFMGKTLFIYYKHNYGHIAYEQIHSALIQRRLTNGAIMLNTL